MSTAEQKPFEENQDLVETAELPVLQEGSSEGAVIPAEEPEVSAAPEGESLLDSLKRNPLNTDINRYRSRDGLASDGRAPLSSREIAARQEADKKRVAEAEARQAIEEATAEGKQEPDAQPGPVNKGMPKVPEFPRLTARTGEKPAAEPVAKPETQPEPVQPEVSAPSRSRAARRGRAAAVPPVAPVVVPAPEAAQPATTAEEEQTSVNKGMPRELGSNPIDVAIANLERSRQPDEVNPTERPNVGGEDAASIGPRQSFAVRLNSASTPVPAIRTEQPSPSAAEETSEPAEASEPEESGLNSHLSPEALARLAAFKSGLSESTPTPEAAPIPDEPVAPAPETTTQSAYDAETRDIIARARTFAGEFRQQAPTPAGENEANPDTTEGSAEPTTEPEVGPTPAATTEPETQPEPAARPEAGAGHGRHRRGTPASLAGLLQGYTSSREANNETTQQIRTVSSGEAEPAPDSTSTGETRPLTRRQRLRAKLGSIATAIGGFVDTDRRTEPLSPEEIAERNRISGARRTKIVTGLGLAAAAAGLVSTINADTANESRPRAPISANQLPGQQQETNESSLADRAKEALADAQERLREAGEKPSTPQAPEESDKTVRTDHENITVSNDGSVTVELRQGGNYWEGIREAEQLLDIDDSATATANAVNTIGFEEGEDRGQKVGAKVTFKNVNGKLVAVRS